MSNLQEQVWRWWNRHPYTYGLSCKDGYRDVGDIPDEKLGLLFFDEYMRKARKNKPGLQQPNEDVAASVIDYPSLHGKWVFDIARETEGGDG